MLAALVPFSPLRGYVLGMRESRERTTVTEVRTQANEANLARVDARRGVRVFG